MYEGCVTAIDLGDVSKGSGQAKLVYWTDHTRLGSPHEMDWELPYDPKDRQALEGLSNAVGGIISNRLEAIAIAAGMPAEAVKSNFLAVDASPSFAMMTKRMSQRWRPGNLSPSFTADAENALASLITQITLCLVQYATSRVSTEFKVTFTLPKRARIELATAEATPVAKNIIRMQSANPNLISSLLASINRDLIQFGWRNNTRPLYVEAEQTAADSCILYLRILALFQRASQYIQVDLQARQSRVTAKVRIGDRSR